MTLLEETDIEEKDVLLSAVSMLKVEL